MPLMPLKCEVLPGNRSTDLAPEAGPEVGPGLAPEVTEVTPHSDPELGGTPPFSFETIFS